MAVNGYKLIITVILINLMTSMLLLMQTGVYYDEDSLNNVVSMGEQYAEDTVGTQALVAPDNLQEQQVYGNPISQGAKIFGLLARGLTPFPFSTSSFSNPLFILIAWGLAFIKTILYIMLGMYAYDKIFNKKQD